MDMQWAPVEPRETWLSVDVEDTRRFLVSGRLRGPSGAGDNYVVLRFRFFGEDRTAVPTPLRGLSSSATAGAYVYPQRQLAGERFNVQVDAPLAAVTFEYCIQLWRKNPPEPFEVSDLAAEPVDDGETTTDATDFDGELIRFGEEFARRFLVARRGLLPNDSPLTQAFLSDVAARTPNSRVTSMFARRLLWAGRSSEALAFRASETPAPRGKVNDASLDKEQGLIDLLAFARSELKPAQAPRLGAKGMVYLLHNSLPYHSGGYAARADGLLKGFMNAGWEVFPILRPNYPDDRGRSLNAPSATVDGVTYRFFNSAFGQNSADQVAYVKDYARQVLDSVDHASVGAVQAASFFHNAFAGRLVADALGVPLIYEMRGLDWFTAGSKAGHYFESEHGRLMRDLELEAARCADHVLAITGALRAWLIEEGIPAEKIGVLANGCIADRFSPQVRDPTLAAELGLEGATVIGYIGSVMFYEGVEFIAEAVGAARRTSGRDIRFLLVGDGPFYQEALARIREIGAEPYVCATGRVPHDQVQRYYSICDAIALGRRRLPVCEVISPLKPLEAMAMGIPVVSTDVAAVAEMIDASGGGLLAPAEDVEGYGAALVRIAESPELRVELGVKARRWAQEKREWVALATSELTDLATRF